MRMLPFVVRLTLSGLFAGSTVTCHRDKPNQGSPPPPPPPAATPESNACAAGAGSVADPITGKFFPATVGSYCIDPHAEVRVYGAKEKYSMDEVCTTAFDGECEVYKRFGLKRVVSVRYVDGKGVSSVDIYLSQFDAMSGAYGLFTQRVVAGGDPADPTAPRDLPAGGAGAIGTGRAYVWKSDYLVELQYGNEQESPEQLTRSSDAILAELGKAIGARLPGDGIKPPSAEALPVANRLAGGIQFYPKAPLGLAKLGNAAVGFYREGEKRYRAMSLVRDTAEKAKEEIKVLRGRPGALPVTGVGEEAVHTVLQDAADGPKSEYIFARKGDVVLAVGDEDFAAKPSDPHTQSESSRLSKDEKLAKLKDWLASLTATDVRNK